MTPREKTAGSRRRPRTERSPAVSRLGLNLALAGFVFTLPVLLLVVTEGELQPPNPAAPVVASRIQAPPSVLDALEPVEEAIFLRHVRTRLPRYVAMFKLEAQRHDISWHLLASQAYQESRWNPRAISPTGVRGIMMLTRNTSSALGIKNRLDPHASIRGGARHLARLLKRVPGTVDDGDRLWVALAAYNVGMGHVKDARRLAVQLGKDPDQWEDLQEILPLLAKRKYYRSLPHGYARGWEPVVYVKRIRAFEQLLRTQFPSTPAASSPQL